MAKAAPIAALACSYSTPAVSSDKASFIEWLSGAVWLLVGDASGAGFFRAPGRRVPAFFGGGASTAVLGFPTYGCGFSAALLQLFLHHAEVCEPPSITLPNAEEKAD
ncbi:MAG: hypothetical protein EON94_07025 [Caulobacteraceae bacterium]|nr:MAG: hypothetical protein EON94_07025 [Caulobacteraceae bacterium]